jgi:hypothetical protein
MSHQIVIDPSLVPQKLLPRQMTRAATIVPPTLRILTLTSLPRLLLGRGQRLIPLLCCAAERDSDIPISRLCPSQSPIYPGSPISGSFEADITTICVGTCVAVFAFRYCESAGAVVDHFCIGVSV